MARYLIKATYLEGDHAGESYLLQKGGYVTDEDSIQWDATTYANEGICRRVCSHLKQSNDLDCRVERAEEAYRMSKGGKPKTFYIYTPSDYEPYLVNADNYSTI